MGRTKISRGPTSTSRRSPACCPSPGASTNDDPRSRACRSPTWRAGSIALEDRDHDGVWHGVVVLPTGLHEYMFVVDGERWVTDPLAGRYVEDDFGRENSVLIVRPVTQ